MVFHTGKLKEYLSLFALKDLNVWRNNAELVDTIAEDVCGGVVDVVLHLILECRAYGVVAHARTDNVLEYD